MKKNKSLNDSFEEQKMTALAIAKGLLDKEIKSSDKVTIQQSEIDKAKAR